jgi:hypothetical protein
MQLDDVKKVLRGFRPANVRRLASLRLSTVVLQEARRSKRRVAELRTRSPSAGPRELSYAIIEQKKQVAALVGGISGAFGVAGIPADLVAMAFLEIQLLVDVATAHEVRLEFPRSREELLEVLGTANGVGSLGRASPKVLGKVAQVLFERGGLANVGRAFPLVAAPITSWLNNRDIQKLGDAALRHYGGFPRASAKRDAP